MIRIGVSPCFMYPDPSRIVFGHKSLTYVENDMLRYLYRENEVMPVLIMDMGGQSLEMQMQGLSGIVFTGGTDLDPATYGENYLDRERWPGDPIRDAFEGKIFDYAMKVQMPMLGICRGAQLINAKMGGTLIQDIGIEVKDAIKHRDPDEYDRVHHRVKFDKEGPLAEIYGQDEGVLNSVHHQAIKTLGKNLVANAFCPEDGIIEGFHSKTMSDHYIIGVQWHPEFSHTLGEKVLDPTPLYDHFLAEAKKWTS